MHDSEPIITTRNLTRRFDGLTAVDHLDLAVGRGEIFGLLGPDGAGKTTTLRMLAGLMDPQEGEARIAGMDTAKSGDRLRDVIGYMAQRFGLYPDLTVEENLAFYADLFGVGRDEYRMRTERLLDMTRMAEFRGRQAGRLSGGMKQKLALMCALLHRPQVLLLDEPTNGVDPVSRRDFWAILYDLVREGVTVLVTTAYLDEAERCNRVGLMHKGRLIWCDTPAAARRAPTETCFAVECTDRAKGREVLRTAPGVACVEPFGDRLHLFLDEKTGSVGDLTRRLNETGLGPARFERIEPSLEDVFILLIRKSEAPA
ncbi:MAG: ABC transporter ATP-binding protein [Candidatus Sumerlaeia bacterium]|nr:ABC transporter ATP-binding protein [Candidatus Sumerlaeia bacterium]